MMDTYAFVVVDGFHGIRCLRCGKTSYHGEDIRQRYCGHCHHFHDDSNSSLRTPEKLVFWTVYKHPSDYPGLFVARKWLDMLPTQEVLFAPTLNALYAQIPPGLWRFPRDTRDDPVIVEVWL